MRPPRNRPVISSIESSRIGRKGMARFLSIALLALWTITFPSKDARSGTLEVYERTLGPGATLVFSAPASQIVLDIDMDPISGEGGGIYGISELGILATGDLIINSIVTSCQLASCIVAPESFAGGTQLHLTGIDNTVGDFNTTSTIISVSFSGSNGYIVVGGGEYLDATATGQTIGNIQKTDIVPIASVPEPSSPSAILLACLMLSALGRHRLSPGIELP